MMEPAISTTNTEPSTANQSTLVNPIVDSGADPWVIRWSGDYYYCYANNDTIYIARSQTLANIGKVEPRKVWTPPHGTPYSKQIWAPELHSLDNRWYIYFAASDGDNANHRMYVLRGNSDQPNGNYDLMGKISASPERWAIDGTVLTLNDDARYFLWSGWEEFEDVRQNLYIARMDTPWSISSKRVCISYPNWDWEKAGSPDVNEAPQVLTHDGRIFVSYSASGSWTDDYCLGQLTYLGGDILNPQSWRKHPAPVFAKTTEVFGPGHACFIKSDGDDDWIIYHAAKHKGAGWNRNIRAQRFSWNSDGQPDFGTPVPPGVPIPTKRA